MTREVVSSFGGHISIDLIHRPKLIGLTTMGLSWILSSINFLCESVRARIEKNYENLIAQRGKEPVLNVLEKSRAMFGGMHFTKSMTLDDADIDEFKTFMLVPELNKNAGVLDCQDIVYINNATDRILVLLRLYAKEQKEKEQKKKEAESEISNQ